MKKYKFWAVVVIGLLLVAQFLISLLTNYASATIPKIITDNPNLVWYLIASVIAATFILTLIQIQIEGKKSTIRHHITNSGAASWLIKESNKMYQHDVFISYSHKDSDWVRSTLLPKLEEHGFRVLIDFRDFKGGAFGVEEMERGVLESRYTMPVFTPHYFESEWSKLENVMAQTMDPAAKNRRIIPVLRETTDIPLRLRTLLYRDLRDDSDEQKWQLLIRDLV